jgi:predicted DNA-binding transcriptional regulator AlpA
LVTTFILALVVKVVNSQNETVAQRRQVYLDDLIDAGEVAEMLGLGTRNTVSTYQQRYPAMPRPVIDRSGGRTKLWLRSEIEGWVRRRAGQ